MRDDLKSAFRSLWGDKSFSVPSLIVLTLAIGATTALFSVVDAVALRGLPFEEQGRLVAVGERRPPTSPGGPRDADALLPVAPQNYLDWAAQQQVFESLAAIASGWLTLHRPGNPPESLVPQYVTATFFDVLRVRPAVGRAFGKENEIAGRDRVVVLSDGLWRRAFGGDPHIVGRAISLDDLERGRAAYEVVGVMPPEFEYPVGAVRATDLWAPYVVPPNQRLRSSRSRVNHLQVIARLQPGVTLEQAHAQMNEVAAALERAHPRWNADSSIAVRPLVDHVVDGRTRSWMLLLLGAVGIVLLIACANVASLVLARATARQRDLGICSVLGATRLRLIRQLLMETLVLSAAGTVCAVLVAWWAVGMLTSALPDNVPRVTTIGIDFRVLAAAAGVSVLTAVLVGVLPALRLSRRDPSEVLKDGGRASAGTSGRVRGALIVAEVALTVVLLVGAALFITSFIEVMRVDPGFNPANVLTAQVSPRVQADGQPADSGAAFSEVVERVSRIPGVRHAAVVGANVPLLGGYNATSLTIPGKNLDLTAGEMIGISTVTPDYHKVMGIPLRRGRLFDGTDRGDAPGVAIVNESAARRYFPGEDLVGQQVGLNGSRTIVGIVGDIHQTSLETAPRPEAYLPMAQMRVAGGSLVVRTSGNPYDTLASVRSAVFAVLPDVPLRNVITMEELVDKRLAQRRLTMLLLGLFGVLGLVISAVGVYGVVGYAVSQRTREIGVRMAVGATPSRILAMVLLHAAALVLTGSILGGVGAWYLSAAARAFLFGIQPTDARAFAAAFLLLAGAAAVATLIPARRAASVDPITALRTE